MAERVKLILSAICAAVLTYFLNINLGFGPFIASALVGLIAAKVFPRFSPAMYAASFASMSSPQILPNISLSGIIGLTTGLLYVFTLKIFIGLGGKLGAIAFFSVLPISLLSSSLYLSHFLTYLEGLSLIFGSCLGALLTYYITIRFKQNPVFSSSIVVLSAALILNFFLRFNNNLVSAITCGSYAGMSSKEIIRNYRGMLFIGLLSGIILFLTWPFFYGVGGRLGLIAFLAVFLSRLIP